MKIGEDLTAVSLESCPEIMDVNAGYLAYKPIRNPRRNGAGQERIGAGRSPTRDHVVAFFDLFDEVGYFFRSVLQVSIESNNILAACVMKPRHQCGRLAVVSSQVNDGYSAVLPIE